MSISLSKNLNKKELNKLKQNLRIAVKDITHEKKLEWNLKEGELVTTKIDTICYYKDESGYIHSIQLEKDSILIVSKYPNPGSNDYYYNNNQNIFCLYDGKIIFMNPLNLLKI